MNKLNFKPCSQPGPFSCRYKLVSKTTIAVTQTGHQIFQLHTPIPVKQGYFPGFHFDNSNAVPCIPESSEGEVFDVIYNGVYDAAIIPDAVITILPSNTKKATYSFAAKFTPSVIVDPEEPGKNVTCKSLVTSHQRKSGSFLNIMLKS